MQTNDTKLSSYEITFITKEDPTSVGESIVKKIVESFDGRIISEVKLGQKNFVYPIKKEKSGFYTSFVFKIDPSKVQDINRKLLLEEEILRFLIVAINVKKDMSELPVTELKPEEITGEPEDTTAIIEPETEIIEAPVTEIVTSEPVIEEEAAEEAKEEVAKEIEKEEAPKKEKVTSKSHLEPKSGERSLKPVKKEKPAKTEPKEESESEEDRLEALDKKLEELLKD